MRDLSRLKIVEIGGPWLKGLFPQQTLCFSPFNNGPKADPDNGLYPITLRTLPMIHRAVRDPDVSLIVCRPLFYPPWHWQWITRELFSRRTLQGDSRYVSGFGAQFLRLPVRAPIAVLDTEDYPAIRADRFFLWSRCKVYFKRELPPDRWRLFMGTAHDSLPTPRFRENAMRRQWLEKVRPISLGVPDYSDGILPEPLEKTSDVFFIGDTGRSSSIRSTGMRELLALRDSGVKVDIPEGRLPLTEFYRRAAQAWLVWSPEGLGWDCFRHYEAPACHSVAVINRPTIETHCPLIDGEHAFYYDTAPGGLTATIRAALADKDRLRSMARAGHTHVMKFQTQNSLGRYVVETALEADDAPR